MKSGGLLINYLGQAWSALLSFVFIPFYIKYLGPESYALVGFYAVFQAWMSILDSGLSQYIQREAGRIGGQIWQKDAYFLRRYLARLVFLSEGVAVALSAVSIAIGFFFSLYFAGTWFQADLIQPALIKKAIVLMSLAIAIRFFESFYRAVLLGSQRYWFVNLHTIVFSTLRSFGALLLLVLFNVDVVSFFWWQLFIAAWSVIAFKAYLSFRLGVPLGVWLRSSPSPSSAISFKPSPMTFAKGAYGLALLSTLIFQADRVVLSRVLPMYEYGYFSAAAGLSAIILLMIAPVSAYFFPQLCIAYESNNRQIFRQCFCLGTQIIVVTTGSIAFMSSMISEQALFAWSQDALMAKSIAPTLSFLMLGNFLNVLTFMPYLALLAAGNTVRWLRIYMLFALLYVSILFLVAQSYGALGSSASWFCMNLCLVFVVSRFGFEGFTSGFCRDWLLRSIIYPVLSALSAATICGIGMKQLEYLSRLEFLFLFVLAVFLVSICALFFARDLRSHVLKKIVFLSA